MANLKDLIVQGNSRFIGDTNLGTISSGTWNGGVIGIPYGGTGTTTAAGIFGIVRDNGGDGRWVKKAGDTMSGTLIFSGISTSNWTEGIRVNRATNGWATITIGGTATSGTGTNIWSLHENGGNFYLNRNGSDTAQATRLWGHANGYTIGSTGRASANLTVTSWLEVTGSATNTMTYNTTNPRITFSESGSQAVGIVYTDYDSYRTSKGLKVMDVDNTDTGNVWLEAQGYIYGAGFVKAGSSDSKVLLGGGGDKAESSLSVNYASSAYNVYQTETNTASWRGLAFGYNTSSTVNSGVSGAVYGPIYISNNITAQSSTGSIAAGAIGCKGTNGDVTGGYIAYPNGCMYATNASSKTGYLKITLPTKGQNCMMSFDVTIFTYEGSNQSYATYHISGYEYSSNGWYEPVTKVYSEGVGNYTNLKVRLGNDGTYACVTIGESTTVWSYPQVSVHNIMTGYSGCAVSTWIAGWQVGFTTTALTTIVAERSSVNTQAINITGNSSYATSAGSASTANALAFERVSDMHATTGWRFFTLNNSSPSNGPGTSGWAQGVTFLPNNDTGGYRHIITFWGSGSNNSLWIKNQWAGTWGSWRKILDSNNYTDYVKNASLTLQTAGTTRTTFYANDSTNRTFNVTCSNIGAQPVGNYVQYTSESNHVQTITVASSPGSNANTLYIII